MRAVSTSGAQIDVVIGAGSGMGAAVAGLLTPERGLLVVDLDGEAAARTAEEVSARTGRDVTALACDITNADDVARVVEAVEAIGTLGSLVVTAGLSPTMAGGHRIFEVNLVALSKLLTAFEPTLTSGSAAVVFSSMSGHMMPADDRVDAILDDPEADDFLDRLDELGIGENPGIAYGVSKRGVQRLAANRAVAWGRKGARIVSLSPGIIDTPMGRLEDANQPGMAGMVTASAAAREGRPEEVAAVAAFLTGPQASFVTGTDILVDGGAVAAFRNTGGDA